MKMNATNGYIWDDYFLEINIDLGWSGPLNNIKSKRVYNLAIYTIK